MKKVLFLIFLVIQVYAIETYSQDDEGFLGDGFESRPRQLFIIDGNEVWGWGNTKVQRAGTYDFQWDNWTGTTCPPYYIKICINTGTDENPVYETITGKTFTTPSGTSEYTLSEQKRILFFLYYNINNNSCMYVYYKSDGPPAPLQNVQATTTVEGGESYAKVTWNLSPEEDVSSSPYGTYQLWRRKKITTWEDWAQISTTIYGNESSYTDRDIYGAGSGPYDVEYKLKAVDRTYHVSDFSSTAALDWGNSMQKRPTKFASKIEYNLFYNYPNPFNPTTKIKYTIKEKGLVTLKVFDILGREIETLVRELKDAGEYEVEFDGGNLQTGLYLYKLTIKNYTEVKKMILLK